MSPEECGQGSSLVKPMLEHPERSSASSCWGHCDADKGNRPSSSILEPQTRTRRSEGTSCRLPTSRNVHVTGSFPHPTTSMKVAARPPRHLSVKALTGRRNRHTVTAVSETRRSDKREQHESNVSTPRSVTSRSHTARAVRAADSPPLPITHTPRRLASCRLGSLLSGLKVLWDPGSTARSPLQQAMRDVDSLKGREQLPYDIRDAVTRRVDAPP